MNCQRQAGYSASCNSRSAVAPRTRDSSAEHSSTPGMLLRHKGELMADKSKMSVADILAAARKADAPGGSSEKHSESTPQEVAPSEVPPAAETPSAGATKKPAVGGARPSVAEMLAMARGDKAAPAAAPAKPKE